MKERSPLFPTLTSDTLEYSYFESGIAITGYAGAGGNVVVPCTIESRPVTAIWDRAFRGCTGLTGVTIADSVTTIGERAFQNCFSLTGVTIGKGLVYIAWMAFDGCSRLTAITVHPANEFHSSVDGVLFDKSGTTLIRCPGGKSGNYTIPDSVTYVEGGAFRDCSGLTAITVHPANECYSSVDGVLFDKSQSTLIHCVGRKSGIYTIPDSVTTLGHGAFCGCTGLTGMVIPDSVTTIGDAAFCGCAALARVMIGKGVTSIGPYAFEGCTSLVDVYLKGDAVPRSGMEFFQHNANVTVYRMSP